MKKSERVYNTQRTVGVWLMYIGVIIIFSALFGGDALIQPIILGVGFGVGYFLIYGLPFVNNKLAYGMNTKFQDRMDNASIIVTIFLCTLCGLLIGFEQPRLVWLCILLVIGLHFFGFYFSQGKLMLLLGGITFVNAFAGLLFANVPFWVFAFSDGLIKILFGIKMFTLKRGAQRLPVGNKTQQNL